VAAVALGAEFIEKHLTLDNEMAGPDHRASLDPAEFAEMVRQVRSIEKALGDGIKWPNPSEEKIKAQVRRRVVAASKLKAGTCLDWGHLCFKRADYGIWVEQADSIIGKKISVELAEDAPIDWNSIGDYVAPNNS
jgi:sialic acid synthase SpsE